MSTVLTWDCLILGESLRNKMVDFLEASVVCVTRG